MLANTMLPKKTRTRLTTLLGLLALTVLLAGCATAPAPRDSAPALRRTGAAPDQGAGA